MANRAKYLDAKETYSMTLKELLEQNPQLSEREVHTYEIDGPYVRRDGKSDVAGGHPTS